MSRLAISFAILLAATVAQAGEPPGLHAALDRLTRDGKFSGAVVIRGAGGIRFARGYGFADPFSGRRFTPETPVDSASLAKPVTAAVVLSLAHDGRLDLDAPVRRYLAGYPHEDATVRHLLAHSAGLPGEEALEPLVGKTNEMLMDEVRGRRLPPLFPPGSEFTYCNLCYSTLALLAERVGDDAYLRLARARAGLPAGASLRPRRLTEWRSRAIGYRRTGDGALERADSYEDEAFYGSANLSMSASQLAAWGAQWWGPQLEPGRADATTPARIGGAPSGLTWGNWYCAPGGRRCHYLGHHEGFHHMLYWDAERRLSVAMVSNNTLAPGLQQRIQRALVAFAEGREASGRREMAAELPDRPVAAGAYRLGPEETVTVSSDGSGVSVARHGLKYRAYRIGAGVRYVPGLDAYLSGADDDRLHWLSLYEDVMAEPTTREEG